MLVESEDADLYESVAFLHRFVLGDEQWHLVPVFILDLQQFLHEVDDEMAQLSARFFGNNRGIVSEAGDAGDHVAQKLLAQHWLHVFVL
jgi:hypothetical protein